MKAINFCELMENRFDLGKSASVAQYISTISTVVIAATVTVIETSQH
jgi:hypothetical protein